MDEGGLSPASDLFSGEELGNRVRSPGVHIYIDA